MDRVVIERIKSAALLQNWEALKQLSEIYPEETVHAAIEHEVGSIIFQPDEHE